MLNENLIKGQIIELKVQEEMLRYGFDVSVPNYNASKYDLIVDTGTELLKIQVKKSISHSKNSFSFSCTTQNVKSSSKAKHKYTKDEIDYFATVWQDKVYLIPVEETSQLKTLQLEKNNYGNFANDYLAENIFSEYSRLSDEQLYNSAARANGKNYCKNCGCEISSEAEYCVPCNNLLKRKVERPSREELKRLIRTESFLEIGRKYKVTDNAIRKWCDMEHLPRRKSDIMKYTNEEWEQI